MIKKVTFIVLSVSIVLLFTACGGGEKAKQSPLNPVKFAEVKLLGETQSRSFSGTAKSSSEARLSFRTSGVLQTLTVQPGDSVSGGELIARLDTKDAELQLQQARAQLQNARVQQNNAEANLERVRELYQVGNISLSEYEQAKAQASNTHSQLESASKNLDLKQSQLNYHSIQAPAAGAISNVSVETNELVQAGEAVVTLNSGEGIEVEVGAPESFITRIEQGGKVRIRFSSVPDSLFSGTVSEVSVAPGKSSTYPVTVTVDNAPRNIRSGMSAQVTFTFTRPGQHNQMVIPVDAVDKQDNSSYVFVLQNKEGDIYQTIHTEIQLGELTEGGFIVKSGLELGDYVATAGISSLYDGRKVSLLKN